jgi:hypothetical protein
VWLDELRCLLNFVQLRCVLRALTVCARVCVCMFAKLLPVLGQPHTTHS